MIVRVITDIKHEAVNQTYDYHVPNHIKNIERGMRIIVPFGAQTRLAYVIDVLEESVYATKEIIDCLDITPTITGEMFAIIDLLLKTNKKTYAEVVHTVVPKELFVKYKKVIKVLNKEKLSPILLKYAIKNEIKINKELLNHQKEINLGLKNGSLKIVQTYIKRAQTLKKVAYCLNELPSYAKLDKYKDITNLFDEEKTIFRSKLIQTFGTSKINTLEKHGVLIKKEEVYAKPLEHYFDFYDKKHTLTNEQNNAITSIIPYLGMHQTILLKGITGSGKTEVYLQLMQTVLKRQQKILLLVPEITLIGPMLQAVKGRFNEEVAIYHSALNDQERFEQYKKIVEGDAKIIIGTRKIVFLNIVDLGLMMIDEAHDNAYLQTEHVEYSALDILAFKSKNLNIPLLLGTATPSIEQMYLAEKKTYHLVEMHQRATAMPLPTLEIVDMRMELKNGNTTIFSKTLKNKIEQRLQNKEQILLLFNRKGYAPFVMCRQCSHVPTCSSCQLPLTYSKEKNELRCRYCNHKESFKDVCDVCSSKAVKPVGIGIEYIDTQITKHFPKAKTLRMDRDVLTKKGSEEIVWQQFVNQEADILLGTQMIAKGFDFPNVTLAVVLMADMAFKVPTFKASEEAYMLFTQLIGRSGRTQKGEAIIQAYDTKHYSITHLKDDYKTFYQRALSDRKLADYAPFGKLHYLVISGFKYLKTYQTAFSLMKKLKTFIPQVLGPNEPYLKIIKNKYRFMLTLKGQKMDYEKIFKTMDEMIDEDIMIDFHPLKEVI